MKEFDKVYKHYDRFMSLFNLCKIEELGKLIDCNGEEVVVDIGGGTGTVARYFSERCNKIYVVDESEGMLSEIKPTDNIIPILGDALSLDFKDETIDMVILSDVFHHIKDQKKLIEEIGRVLKKGGRLVLRDFEKKCFKTKVLCCFEFVLFGKLYFKSIHEIIALLEEEFTISKVEKRGYYFMILGEKK